MLTNKDVTELAREPDETVPEDAPEPEAYQTLESIREIVQVEEDVDTTNGLFRIRALDFGEVIQMKEEHEDGSEWEATKAMLSAALVKPPINNDAQAEDLGRLSPKTVQKLVEAIAELAGMEQDNDESGVASFKGGSPTG